MASSEMVIRVTLVRTDVTEEFSASFIRVTRIGELGTLAVTSNRRTRRLTRATRRNIPEDGILHSHRRENLKSYIDNICTSQETHVWASTACYRDSCTFVYAPTGLHSLLQG
jgi:hypothetical protein